MPSSLQHALCANCGHSERVHQTYDNSCDFEDCRCGSFVERKPPRVGVAVLVWKSLRVHPPEKLLLFHLRKGEHGPGTWSFPGGGMEWGEDPEDTARRELTEECGPDLKIGDLRVYDRCPYVNTLFASGVQWITLYFEADYLSGEPRVVEPEKCAVWDWFSPQNLPRPLFDPLEPHKLKLKLGHG